MDGLDNILQEPGLHDGDEGTLRCATTLPTSSAAAISDHKDKPLPSSPEPSKADIDAHNLTHLPYRRWRCVCVRTKGKDHPHTGTSNILPLVPLGPAFIGGQGAQGQERNPLHCDGTRAAFLPRCSDHRVSMGIRTQLAMAIAVPYKTVNRDALMEFKRFIHALLRLGHLPCESRRQVPHIAKALWKTFTGHSSRKRGPSEWQSFPDSMWGRRIIKWTTPPFDGSSSILCGF